MKRNISIRQIQAEDKGNYLKLFNSEDFGCVGINSDLKPSIYEEERILTGVIDGTILSTRILVIEDNNEFVGYTSISRPSEHSFHIGQFVIRKDKQRKGYGKLLMNEIKEYALAENCDIKLECISNATTFFEKQGFTNVFSSSYTYPRKKALLRRKATLFPSYDLIRQEKDEKSAQEIKSFQKFLESPLFKEIMKLWYNIYRYRKEVLKWV